MIAARATRLVGLAALALAAAKAPAQSFPCLLEPSKIVNASTAVEGILEVVAVDKGDIVEAGQVVAALEASVEAAIVEAAEARVTMTASLRAREEELKLARLRYERAEGLLENKFIAEDELDELRSTRVVAELRLLEEKENRRLSEFELRRVQATYEQRIIRSPIDGVVVDRYLSPGEFAQAKPIVQLAQLDPIHVELVLPSDQFGTVREGMRARVRTPGANSIEFVAVVSLVERVVDAASDTFGVRLEMSNPDFAIPVGLDCTALFLREGE